MVELAEVAPARGSYNQRVWWGRLEYGARMAIADEKHVQYLVQECISVVGIERLA